MRGARCFPCPHKELKSKTQNLMLRHIHTPSERSNKIVGKWLLTCSGMVFAAVTLGGVTRLTESGLSMVTWKFLGEKMPQNMMEWEKEFENYKQFPEYKMKNRNMTVEEFKFIFMMEYIHRMWGRAIGVVFLVPAVFFWKRGFLCSKLKKYVSLLGLILGAQGLMGWYMVKSGLENRFHDVNDVPRVSQYRLASHLAAAFVFYALLFSKSLSLMLPKNSYKSSSIRFPILNKMSLLTSGLVFVTAISGAFVAGLDAGLVYNSFPKMGDNWIPDDLFSLHPKSRNFTENPTTVQFDHRILGISTLTVSTILWICSKRINLPPRCRWAINTIHIMAWTQATLGITTLLNHVPIPLAAMHQSGSLLLLSFTIWLRNELHLIKYVPK